MGFFPGPRRWPRRERCACGTPIVTCVCGDPVCPTCDPPEPGDHDYLIPRRPARTRLLVERPDLDGPAEDPIDLVCVLGWVLAGALVLVGVTLALIGWT